MTIGLFNVLALAQEYPEYPEPGAGAGLFGGAFLIVWLAVLVLVIAGVWKVFTKAGQPGWASIIPIYNFYVLMQISGKPGWWCFLLFVPVVGFAIQLLAMLSLADKFQRSAAFGVGLLLLPMFFFPLLAFGGSKYGGTPEELDFTFSEEPPVP